MRMRRPSSTMLAAAVFACACATASPALASPYHLQATRAGLDVAVDPDDGGGTMHFANRVTMRGPSGPASVFEMADDALEKGAPLLPLFGRAIELPSDPSTAMLLGWSSVGAGMETVHAWIVRVRPGGAPAIVDELAWATDRVSAGLVVDLSRSGVRVGVPWTFDGAMHDPEDWALDAGAQHLSRDDVMKLPFQPTRTAFDAYRPPFGPAPWPAGTRVAWISATPRGFRL
jgi:hypothetical protein